MKTSLRKFLPLVAVVAAVQPALPAAENASTAREEKRELLVLAAPDRAHRVIVQSGEKLRIEKETVTFLGVETASVSATTAAQLGLPRGTGLVVNHVVPNSPATGALNVHDILLKQHDFPCVAVVGLRPQVAVRTGFQQLSGDQHAIA